MPTPNKVVTETRPSALAAVVDVKAAEDAPPPLWKVEVPDSHLAPLEVRAADERAAVEEYRTQRGIWALPSAPVVTRI